MHAISPARPTWRAALTNRAFIVHYLEMLGAMAAGMVVLGPLVMHVYHHAGADLEALLMVTAMVAGMAVWMAYRRHPLPGILEMGVSMYLSVVVLLPLYWLGALASDRLMDTGHILMFPAMALCMLHRREGYIVVR